MNVVDWLRALGLEQYEAAFRENEVTVEVLRHLTAEDLKELGVAAVGHRRQLMVAIARLRDEIAVSAGVTSPDDLLPSVGTAERRHITVMFCDIVGSTPLSTGLDPEDLRELLSVYQASVATAVTSKHGHVARFVGDGVLAYFGWPNADETHAESAVRAALEIVEAVGRQKLAVRLGIATGLVVTGDLVGVGAAQTVTAVGETPNLAARLQGLAQPDTIVVSEATRSQLGQMFDVEDLGPQALKGFDKPISAWRVRGKTEAESRSEAVYVSTLTPLIGRDEELDLLQRRWSESKSGEGRVVLLSGEAGIGKSRLLAALEERLAAEPHVSLRYFCSPHHKDSPLYPVIAKLEREAGFVRSDTAADRLAKLEAILAPTMPSTEDISLLATLLSIPAEGRYASPALSAQQRKVRTVAALLRRLTGLASKGPVVLLFEDAHWSDPSSIELLDAAIELVPALPVLLVVSFRPEFAAPWFGRPRVSLMALSRLDRRDATALAAQIVKSQVLSSPLLERIVMQSDGVPLFIEELTRAVLEAPEPGGAGTPLTVPDTLQASLMARLDRLPAAKAIAQIGSVIGREFAHGLLATAAGVRNTQLEAGLNELAASGLLFRRGAPPDAVYMFKHALVRDVVYASLPKASRQRLHRIIGETIRDELPDRAAIEPEVVAQHFSQAGLKQDAVDWWSKAGDIALQRSANIEAIAHLEKALEGCRQLEDTPEQRLRQLHLQISHGNALRAVRGFAAPETRAAFAQARSIAGAVGDFPARFSAYHGQWGGSFLCGDLAGMQELVDRCLREVEDRPVLPETGAAHRIAGATCWFSGDFVNARQHLEMALTFYDDKRDIPLIYRFGQDLAVPAMIYLALTLWPLGIGEGARSVALKAIDHAVTIKHTFSMAYAYVHAAIFEIMRRDRLQCGHYVRAGCDLAREHAMPLWVANGTFEDGWLRWHAGDRDGGTALMRDGLQLMHGHGQSVYIPFYKTLVAETEAEAGQYDAAVATVDGALGQMVQTGQCWYLAEAHRTRGELMLRRSSAAMAEAEAEFTQAIVIARNQSAKRFELCAAMSLARLWKNQGQRVEHQGLLSILTDGIPDGSQIDGLPNNSSRDR